MDLGMTGKRALVTGSTSGIGFAIAKCLLAEGAEVIVSSRNSDHVENAIRTLKTESKSDVQGFIMDMQDEESIRNGIKKVLSTGSLSILVINSGGPIKGDVTDIPLEEWDRGYRLLVRSVLISTQLVLPQMKSQRWGRILNVTSTSARETIPGLPVSSTFRAGLTALTKELAKSVGRQGILINNLLPGPTRTARLEELKEKSPKLIENMLEQSGCGRLAEPEELGRVAAFLCSNANTYISGTDIVVDGAYTRAL